MQDVNGYYATSASVKGVPEMTMSESFYQGLFMKLVGPNMVGLFYDNNFLGVIVLAVSDSKIEMLCLRLNIMYPSSVSSHIFLFVMFRLHLVLR